MTSLNEPNPFDLTPEVDEPVVEPDFITKSLPANSDDEEKVPNALEAPFKEDSIGSLTLATGETYDEASKKFMSSLYSSASGNDITEDHENVQMLQGLLDLNKEHLLRTTIERDLTNRKANLATGVIKSIIQSDYNADSKALAISSVNKALEEKERVAVEREAIDQLRALSLGDPDVMRMAQEKESVWEVLDDENTKYALLQSKISELAAKRRFFQKKHPIQNAFSTVGDLFLGQPQEWFAEGDFWTGDVILNRFTVLNGIEDPEEYAKELDKIVDEFKESRLVFDNPKFAERWFTEVIEADRTRADMRNVFSVIELLGLAGGYIYKGGKSSIDLLKRTGNKKKIAKSYNKALQQAKEQGKLVEEIIDTDSSILKEFAPNQSDLFDQNISSELRGSLEIYQKVLDDMNQEIIGLNRRLNQSELDELVEKTLKKAESEYSTGSVRGVTTEFNQEIGLDYLVTTFGDEAGAAFASKEAAEKAFQRQLAKIVVKQSDPVERTVLVKRRVGDLSKDEIKAYLGANLLTKAQREALRQEMKGVQGQVQQAKNEWADEVENLMSNLEQGLQERWQSFYDAKDLSELMYDDITKIQGKYWLDRSAQELTEILNRGKKGEDISDLEIYFPQTNKVSVSKEIVTDKGTKPVGGYSVIEADDGSGYYVQRRQVVTDEGNYHALDDKDLELATRFQTYLTEATQWAAKSSVSASRSSSQAEVYVDSLFKEIKKEVFDNTSKTQRKTLEQIMEKAREVGYSENRWISFAEYDEYWKQLTGKYPTDFERELYGTYRLISDQEYTIRNLAQYRVTAQQGYNTVNIMNKDGVFEPTNGRVYRTAKDLTDFGRGKKSKTVRYLDLEEGRARVASQKKVQELLEDGYVFVERQDVKPLKGNIFAPLELRKASEITESPLRFTQVGYVPGGHMAYAGKWFISQRIRGVHDDGTHWFGPMQTKFNSMTKKDAEEFTENMEAARLAYNRWVEGAGDEAYDLFNEAVKKTFYKNTDNFIRAVDDGEILPYTEFKVRFDREIEEVPATVFDDAGKEVPVEDYSDLMDHITSYNVGRGQMYYSKRGDRLKDTYGNKARSLSPLEASSKAVSNAVHHYAWDDFVASELGRFSASFRKFLNVPDAERLTNMEVLIKAKNRENIKTNISPKDRARMIQQANYLDGQLRLPSDSDIAFRAGMRQLGLWTEGQGWLGDKVAEFAYDRNSFNPITRLRGLTYHLHLGFFSVHQLGLQAQSAFAATTMHPILGMKAWKRMPFIRAGIMGAEPSMIREMALRNKWANKDNVEELVEMVTEFRKAGFHQIGHNLSTIDHQPSELFKGSFIRKVAQWGVFFAQEGDRISRIIAFQIARDLARAEGLKTTSRAGREFIKNKTDDLLLGMTASANAFWQRGVLAIPTQFWQHSVKMMTAMTPKWAGGNRVLTASEKKRLLAGQVLLYGSFGVPFGNYVTEKFMRETGVDMPPVVQKFFLNGLLDTMVYAATGGDVDVDFAKVAGTGTWLPSLLDTIMNEPLPVVATGVVGGDLGKAWEAVSKNIEITNAFHNPSPERAARATFNTFKDVFSSLKVQHAAWLALTEGAVYSSRGDLVTRDVTPLEALFISLFNARPSEEHEMYSNYGKSRDMKDVIEDNARMFVELETRRLNTTSAAEREAMEDDIHALWLRISDRYGEPLTWKIRKKMEQWMTPESAYERSLLREKERIIIMQEEDAAQTRREAERWLNAQKREQK